MGLFTPDRIKEVLAHRVKQSVSDDTLMPAAVLLVLYPKDGEYCVLLNKRSEQVEHHRGKFPSPAALGTRKTGISWIRRCGKRKRRWG